MTKDEMLKKYSNSDSENNYKEAQRRIAEAMKKGEKYVLLSGKSIPGEFTTETIARLEKDGFDIDRVWDPFEYWSVEWYDKEY
jgi:hypothetical protein